MYWRNTTHVYAAPLAAGGRVLEGSLDIPSNLYVESVRMTKIYHSELYRLAGEYVCKVYLRRCVLYREIRWVWDQGEHRLV